MLLGPSEQHVWEKWAWDVMQGGRGGQCAELETTVLSREQLRSAPAASVWEAEGLVLPVLGFKKSMQFGFL